MTLTLDLSSFYEAIKRGHDYPGRVVHSARFMLLHKCLHPYMSRIVREICLLVAYDENSSSKWGKKGAVTHLPGMTEDGRKSPQGGPAQGRMGQKVDPARLLIIFQAESAIEI